MKVLGQKISEVFTDFHAALNILPLMQLLAMILYINKLHVAVAIGLLCYIASYIRCP